MSAQIVAARHEEAEQRLETLFALPRQPSRAGSLGRLLLAGGATRRSRWRPVRSPGRARRRRVPTSRCPRMLEAGANCLPAALLFLGARGAGLRRVPPSDDRDRLRRSSSSRSSGSSSARCSARRPGRSTSRRSSTSGSSRPRVPAPAAALADARHRRTSPWPSRPSSSSNGEISRAPDLGRPRTSGSERRELLVDSASKPGNSTRNVVPTPTLLSTLTSPSCDSAIAFTIARPRPLPRVPSDERAR